MPEAWQGTRLEDVATVLLSGVDKHVISGETPIRLCNYLDVYRQRRLTNATSFAGGSARPAEIARLRLKRGDVIITKDSETPDDIGIPAIVMDDIPDVICGYHLAILRPSPELVSEFLLHYLQGDTAKRHFLRSANGLTRFGLGNRAIASLPLLLPRPDEQVAIARILDAIDTTLERTRDAIDRAQQLERAVVAQAFDRLNAPRRKLGEYAQAVRYGTSKASSERGWGHPVLRIPNVVSDRLSLEDLAFVELPPAEVDRLKLSDGDLLLVRTNGNPGYVGRSAVFRRPDNRVWVYASYLIRVRLDERLSPEFVNAFLGIERGRRELLRRVTTSAGNHNINSNSIRLISLPVPEDREEQERIVELARSCRANVDAMTLKAATLGELKTSLMHELLSGRVRVPIAMSEPKAVAS